jgi:dolichol-phosphate mannosyltransferase
LSRKRSLVTGAGGFIGANLVRRLLEDGDAVVATVRPGGEPWRLDGLDLERIELDLEDAAAVRRTVDAARPERAFHLAAHGAYSWQTDRARIIRANLGATLNLLDACVAGDVEIVVNAGSSSEYGYRDRAPTEAEAPEPNSDYAAAKAAATHYAGHDGRSTPHRVVTLRLYSVYGPWEEPARFVPTLVAHALRGELPPLVNPAVARDFVYIGDVCDAFVRAAATVVPSGSIYNIGSGRQLTIADAVAIARSVFGVTAEPHWGSLPDRQWDTGVWVSDPTLARTELGWSVSTPFDQGLSRTAGWLKADSSASGRYAG